MNQKSFLHKETSTNTFPFRISNVFLDPKHLKFAVFSEFQRRRILRHSFQESCLQDLKEAEFAGQSHGPGAHPQVELRMRERESPSLWLQSLSVKTRERQGVVGTLGEEKPPTNGSPG